MSIATDPRRVPLECHVYSIKHPLPTQRSGTPLEHLI